MKSIMKEKKMDEQRVYTEEYVNGLERGYITTISRMVSLILDLHNTATNLNENLARCNADLKAAKEAMMSMYKDSAHAEQYEGDDE